MSELGNADCGAAPGNPVCWGAWKPVGCVWRKEGCGEGFALKPVGSGGIGGGGLLCGRVGTKLLKPVEVGTKGCKRPWF